MFLHDDSFGKALVKMDFSSYLRTNKTLLIFTIFLLTFIDFNSTQNEMSTPSKTTQEFWLLFCFVPCLFV